LIGVGPEVTVAPLDYVTHARFTDLITIAAGLAIFGFPYLFFRWRFGSSRAYRALVLGSCALAFVSAVTGIFNGQTFESVTTPLYAGQIVAGLNPYAARLTVSFVVCGGPTAAGWISCTTHSSSTYYVYLPLLTFLQVPGVAYRYFTLACWVLLLAAVRRDRGLLVAFASPYVGLLAANGYNDFPALVLLTIGLVGWAGRRSKIAEIAALGTKQFANVVVLVYHVVRRDARNAVITVIATILFLVPFFVQTPVAVVCTAVFHETAMCGPGSGADPFSHLDYWLWPLWVVVAYRSPLGEWLRRRRRLFARLPRRPSRRLPSAETKPTSTGPGP
jgi:hypothetical protein